LTGGPICAPSWLNSSWQFGSFTEPEQIAAQAVPAEEPPLRFEKRAEDNFGAEAPRFLGNIPAARKRGKQGYVSRILGAGIVDWAKQSGPSGQLSPDRGQGLRCLIR
jgi:hypothetical protein